jgi:hypothetical protein
VHRISFSLFVVLLIVIAIGCGGIAPISQKPALNLASPQPLRGFSAQDLVVRDMQAMSWDNDRPLDEPYMGPLVAGYELPQRHISAVEALDFAALPELPMPTGQLSSTPGHATSAIQDVDISAPVGQSVNAQALPTKVSLPSIAGSTEWVMYEVPMASSDQLLAINVVGDLIGGPEGAARGVWVGVSNYSIMRVVWFGPFDLAQFGSHTINLPAKVFANGDGNAYIVLAVGDNNVAVVTSLRIDVEPQGIDLLPPEFHTALANAGLNQNLLSARQITVGGTAQPGINEPIWAWGDPLRSFWILRTMLPAFWDAWHDDPTGFPDFLDSQGQDLAAANTIQDLLLEATNEFPPEHQITPQSHSETLDPVDPLARAVADLVDAAGNVSNFPTYQAALSSLDLADQRAIAPVLYAVINAHDARDAVLLNPFGLDEDNMGDLFDYAYGHGPGPVGWGIPTSAVIPAILRPWDQNGDGPPYESFWRDFDHGEMFTGAAKLADAIDDLVAYLDTSPTFEDVSLAVDTSWGRITIGGTTDTTHTAPGDGNGHVFLVDLGGNDTYDCHAGGTAGDHNGVSVCLDVGGNDIYNALDDPLTGDRSGGFSDDNTSQQGAGRWGIGILMDYEGTDSYESVRASQGCGVFGVGILADIGTGGDSYAFEALGQGGAMGGVGILYDAGGDDSYETWRMGQGFGGIMGVGYLVDQGTGTDTYLAVRSDGVPDGDRPNYYVAAYSTNLSCSQGCGLGSRWDWIALDLSDPPDGVIDEKVLAAGGQGICFDGGGDDTYTCGTFGQGMGFFQGLGVLIDMDGDDQYSGHWYSQGATAHAAVAGFWDGSGNDQYENEVSIGIGGAHDMSVTWFLEREGNDIYNASSLSVGTGYNNAFGFFIDYVGNDQYNATYSTPAIHNLGRGGWPAPLDDPPTVYRDDVPSYGIFLDLMGIDTYDAGYQGMLSGEDETATVPAPPADDTAWVRINGVINRGNGYYPLGYGSGLDAQ